VDVKDRASRKVSPGSSQFQRGGMACRNTSGSFTFVSRASAQWIQVGIFNARVTGDLKASGGVCSFVPLPTFVISSPFTRSSHPFPPRQMTPMRLDEALFAHARENDECTCIASGTCNSERRQSRSRGRDWTRIATSSVISCIKKRLTGRHGDECG